LVSLFSSSVAIVPFPPHPSPNTIQDGDEAPLLRCGQTLAKLTEKEAIAMQKTMLRISGVLLAAGLTWDAKQEAHAQDRTASDDALIAKVDQRVQAWQPTAAERRLDDIAWAKDLRDALRLAKDNRRPVFLFTYSGCAEREHALALQRC
jgi:hypothetical protein